MIVRCMNEWEKNWFTLICFKENKKIAFKKIILMRTNFKDKHQEWDILLSRLNLGAFIQKLLNVKNMSRDIIILKLLLAWQLETDFLKTDLLIITGIKNLSPWSFKIILSPIMWKYLGLYFTECIYIWKLKNAYGCLTGYLNITNAAKGKSYNFFLSRSKCVKCSRHIL